MPAVRNFSRQQGGGAGLCAATPRAASVAFQLLCVYTQGAVKRWNQCFRGHRLLPDSEIGREKGRARNCFRNTEENGFRQFST